MRLFSLGFLKATLYALVWVAIDEDTFRAISLRKAEPSERKAYAQEN